MRLWSLIAVLAVIIPAVSVEAAVTPQPRGPTGTWRLAWHDEFTGDEIDTARWTRPAWHVQNVDTRPGNAWLYDGRLVLNLSSSTSGALLRSRFEFKPGMVAEATGSSTSRRGGRRDSLIPTRVNMTSRKGSNAG